MRVKFTANRRSGALRGSEPCVGLDVPTTGACRLANEQGGDLLYCEASCSDVYRCGSDGICPAVSGFPPPCFQTTSGELGSNCLFNTYCVEVAPIPAENFFRCHHVPGTAARATSDYRFGDCDDDGCANQDDSAPCDSNVQGDGCLNPIGGECAPTAIADAGVPRLDGGPNAQDASIGDAAIGARDAARIDGPIAPPPFGFGGGGGCRCSVRSSSAMPLTPMWAVLALIATRVPRRLRPRRER